MTAESLRPANLSDRTPILKYVISWLPPRALDLPEKNPFVFLCLRIGALLAVFIFIELFIRRTTILSAANYQAPYLFLELLARFGAVKLAIVAVMSVIMMRYGALLTSWRSMDLGVPLRWFVVFLAFIMAWPFTTYGYNHFFDQGYYLDRALIAVLVPLIWWRPAFIYPFLVLVFASMWQLSQPSLGGSVLAHKIQVLHVLNLFAAAFLIRAVTGSRRTDIFMFLTCCIVAAAYWEPALAKLKIGWVTHGHLYRLPLAAYAHGWLAFLEPEEIVTFAKTLSLFDWPMRVFVLVIEAGCLFFLWRRSLAIALLGAVIIFHFGVFALYGFLFWTWIMLDAALLFLLLRFWRSGSLQIFSRGHFLLSILLIGLAGLWVNPPKLGWFDTRLTYTYRFQAVGLHGKQYSLPPRFFAPYEDFFTMVSFSYLVPEHGVLSGPYGVTFSREIADATEDATTADEIFALESTIARPRYDAARAARFYAFIVRYTETWNRRHETGSAIYSLRPPPQFWSLRHGEAPPPEETIREIIVTEITTLFDEERLKVIREIELARLEIPATPQ